MEEGGLLRDGGRSESSAPALGGVPRLLPHSATSARAKWFLTLDEAVLQEKKGACSFAQGERLNHWTNYNTMGREDMQNSRLRGPF